MKQNQKGNGKGNEQRSEIYNSVKVSGHQDISHFIFFLFMDLNNPHMYPLGYPPIDPQQLAHIEAYCNQTVYGIRSDCQE